jgi:hypothetical protein
LINLVDRVAEDRYLVTGEAVDLADPIEPCTCGASEDCWHIVAAAIHQARFRRGQRNAA